MSLEYTDKQFKKEFPLKERICNYNKCKKKFLTRFDAKYCCDNHAELQLEIYKRFNRSRYTKSARNLVGKDARIIKGTGRRKEK